MRKKLKLNNDYVLHIENNKSFLVPCGNNPKTLKSNIDLNEQGLYLYEALRDKRAVCARDMVELLLNKYEVTHLIASKDVDIFIQKLRDLGIIIN